MFICYNFNAFARPLTIHCVKQYNFCFNETRGYSLIGKTAILHIVILGSSPNISKLIEHASVYATK